MSRKQASDQRSPHRAAGAVRRGHEEVARRIGLLELLNTALDDVTTFEADYRDWLLPAPSLSLLATSSGAEAQPDEPVTLRWRGGGPFPKRVESRRRIWYAAPDQLRVEILRDGRVRRVGVRDGPRWWRWDEAAGADAGDASATEGSRPLPPLLDPPLVRPVRLLGWVRLDELGAGRRAGREVLTAVGRPRDRWVAERGHARHEFEFDAEHGTILRTATYADRRCVQLTEAQAIAYGCSFGPELFAAGTVPGSSS